MKNRNRSSFTEALTLSHRVGHIVVRSTVALLCLLALGTSLALWRDRIQPVVAAMPARDDKTLSGIKANIVTLPYHTRPTGYPNLTLTAVWQAGSFDEIQVYDGKYDDFRRKYDETTCAS